MNITDRDKAIWRAAITLANNICVQDSDRYDEDDQTTEAHVAIECAKRIRGWAEPAEEQFVEMFDEAGVPPATQPENEDSARLDWLLHRFVSAENPEMKHKLHWGLSNHGRSAIDAARKSTP